MTETKKPTVKKETLKESIGDKPDLNQLIDALMSRPDAQEIIARRMVDMQKVGADRHRNKKKRLNPSAVVEAYGSAIHEDGFMPGIPEGIKEKGPEAERIFLERWFEGRNTSGQRVRELMSYEAPTVIGDVGTVDAPGQAWHEQRE